MGPHPPKGQPAGRARGESLRYQDNRVPAAGRSGRRHRGRSPRLSDVASPFRPRPLESGPRRRLDLQAGRSPPTAIRRRLRSAAEPCRAGRLRRSPHRPVGRPTRRRCSLRSVRRRSTALLDEIVPEGIRRRDTMRLPAAVSEAAALDELRAIAGRNQAAEELHRPGLPRHADAGRDPAERAGEPRLVHRLHALPGRDLARAGWRRCSTSRRWSATSPGCRSPMPRCSTRRPPPPRR